VNDVEVVPVYDTMSPLMKSVPVVGYPTVEATARVVAPSDDTVVDIEVSFMVV
jgi:hypothetical protein